MKACQILWNYSEPPCKGHPSFSSLRRQPTSLINEVSVGGRGCFQLSGTDLHAKTVMNLDAVEVSPSGLLLTFIIKGLSGKQVMQFGAYVCGSLGKPFTIPMFSNTSTNAALQV